MTSRHEDRDGNLNGTFGMLRRERVAGLFILWLEIHARTPVHSHDHDDRVTSVLATRSHRCALSEPYFRLVARQFRIRQSADVSEETECGFVYESKGHTHRRQHRRLCDVRHRQLKAVLKAAAAEGCAQGSGVPKAVLKVCQRLCFKYSSRSLCGRHQQKTVLKAAR